MADETVHPEETAADQGRSPDEPVVIPPSEGIPLEQTVTTDDLGTVQVQATPVAEPPGEGDDPVAMRLAPPGFAVSTSAAPFTLRDEPGDLAGAALGEVPAGATVGKGTLTLDRGGKTFVTAAYDGKYGWAPVDLLREE